MTRTSHSLFLLVLTFYHGYSVTSSNVNAFEGFNVTIMNAEIENLVVHVYSKDNDFGNKTLTVKTKLDWKFREAIGDSTVFKGEFFWENVDYILVKSFFFNVFDKNVAAQCGQNLFIERKCFCLTSDGTKSCVMQNASLTQSMGSNIPTVFSLGSSIGPDGFLPSIMLLVVIIVVVVVKFVVVGGVPSIVKLSFMVIVFAMLAACVSRAAAVISTRWLSKFLACVEHEPHYAETQNSLFNSSGKEMDIIMKDASCAWSSNDQEVKVMILDRVNLSIRKGSLVALIGEIPWILSGSIRDNVLFGKDYDPISVVLEVCALVADVSRMVGGDMAYIGEKGLNLSGGQRAHLAHARAVYHESDLVLLDDVLSAVDVQVAS
nr:ABC transporter C family member 13 [Tanacetum cinerariifolium]